MPELHTDPTRRHDFVLIFDVTDGNPNGDPDAGNLPRTDPETMQGLVTDVALKRKVRNFVSTVSADEKDSEQSSRNKIFVEHRGVLNDQIRRAYTEQGMSTGTPASDTVPDGILEILRDLASTLPSAFAFQDKDEDELAKLTFSGELTKDELKEALDEMGEELEKPVRSFLEKVAGQSKKPDKSRANAERARNWMCINFFDVRMFGAVMSTGLNAGQVRGPVQFTFARSVNPVLPQDLAVTRVAVTDTRDREKLQTIGRKTLIHYGLYVAHGFFSPHLAKDTRANEADLALLWDALVNMWSLDRSASRGMMAPRGLYVFSHERKLGNAPAHQLFERVVSKLNDGVKTPRKFSDYTVQVDESNLPEGVTLTKLLEG